MRGRCTDRVNMVWLLAASLSDVTISHYHSRPSPRYHITITAVRTVALTAAGRLALDRAPLLPRYWSALLASHWLPPVMKRWFSVTTRHAAGSARPSQDAGVGFGRPSATTTVITAPCPSLFVPRGSQFCRLHICQELLRICPSLTMVLAGYSIYIYIRHDTSFPAVVAMSPLMRSRPDPKCTPTIPNNKQENK